MKFGGRLYPRLARTRASLSLHVESFKIEAFSQEILKHPHHLLVAYYPISFLRQLSKPAELSEFGIPEN